MFDFTSVHSKFWQGRNANIVTDAAWLNSSKSSIVRLKEMVRHFKDSIIARKIYVYDSRCRLAPVSSC